MFVLDYSSDAKEKVHVATNSIRKLFFFFFFLNYGAPPTKVTEDILVQIKLLSAQCLHMKLGAKSFLFCRHKFSLEITSEFCEIYTSVAFRTMMEDNWD